MTTYRLVCDAEAESDQLYQFHTDNHYEPFATFDPAGFDAEGHEIMDAEVLDGWEERFERLADEDQRIISYERH